MWAWNFFMYSMNMFFRVVFVTCLLALVSANPLENGFETRITGGRDANKKEFPHQVSLQYSNEHHHRCGGTILSPIWVVTAAHCVDGNRPKILIKAGKFNIRVTEATEQTVEVQHIFVHEHFARTSKRNDIALLKLVKALKFNAHVKKINLPAKNSEPTGRAILSGWGSISRTSDTYYPPILQAVELELLNYRTCEQVFTQIVGSAFSVDQNNVCTSAGNAGLSACTGDSGGPLIQGNKLVGIVSAAILPCGTAKPSIYTKVSSFVDWIHDKINHHQ